MVAAVVNFSDPDTQEDDERGSGRIEHYITLIKRSTGDEHGFKLVTTSVRFKDVLSAIADYRVQHKLFGYEIFEVIDLSDPF